MRALGAVQYLATARTAFDMSGRVDIDIHVKLPTNSWNGQFSTPSYSVADDVTRVHDPPRLRVHDLEAVASIIPPKVRENTRAHLGVHFTPPWNAMVRRLAERQDRHRRAVPEENSVQGKHTTVRRSRGGSNPSKTHKIYYIHKLETSGFRTPVRLPRFMSEKSLLTLSRTVCPTLIALESPLSTGPFCSGVYGAVGSRRVLRPLQ